MAKRGYEDAHIWCFTPASFRLILQDLRSLDLLRLGLIHEFDTAGNEFFVTLGNTANRPAPTERVALLRQIDKELAEAWQPETETMHHETTPLDALDREHTDASLQSMVVSAAEAKMIRLKRRVLEGIRRPFES
jgi:hypothetical protein